MEHAISETIGQGGRPADPLGLELERASEPTPEALPGSNDQARARSPEPTFLTTLDEPPAFAARGARDAAESGAVGAVEEVLANEEALADTATDQPSTSNEPLPWLAAPSERPERPLPRVEHEIATPTFLIAGGYDLDEMRRPTTQPPSPASQTVTASMEASTIVGANVTVAEALESVARRVRGGELRVPAVEPATGEAGALAAVLAVLLGVRS